MNEQERTSRSLKPFVEWLLKNGRSVETARVYASRVRGFLEYLGDVEFNGLSEAGEVPEKMFGESARLSAHLESYLLSRQKPGSNKRTAEAIRTAVHSYFVSMNLPLSAEQNSDAEGESPEPYDLRHLVDPAVTSTKVRLIYKLIGGEGLSIGECASIRMTDMKFTPSETFVKVIRRGRPYLIKLSYPTREALAAWLEDRSKLPREDVDTLILNTAGQAITPNGIDYLVRATAHRQFVDLSPKSLRALSPGTTFS